MKAKKKKVTFVTTNKHKFAEVQTLLKDYPIELTRADMEYPENHDDSLEKIARDGARYMAERLNEPVIVEDTGIFFEAYDNFPGALPKFVIESIGFKGIFKLLIGETRQAYFETVAGYAEPGAEVKIFRGILHGEITEKIFNKDKDVMPYDKIFRPRGMTVTISDLTMEEKNAISQRAKAFRKFGEDVVRDV